MAKYCGGIKLDDTFKVINGVICDADAETVDVSKAISTCGQLWDGDTFYIEGNTLSLLNIGAITDELSVIKAGCGLGLDKRVFTVTNGEVTLVKPADGGG